MMILCKFELLKKALFHLQEKLTNIDFLITS